MTNNIAPADHLLTTSVPEAFEWSPDMVIYHDKCADGIVAAWACWNRWGDSPEYRAANYGYQPPEDVPGKNILIVDFSYPADDLHSMVAAGAKSIVILDHHKTAQAALQPFQVYANHPERFSTRVAAAMFEGLERGGYPPILALFDMDRSGARMAWDFAFPSMTVPRLVELAEQYDLWRFTPGTRSDAELLHLALQAKGLTVRTVEGVHCELLGNNMPIQRGEAIYDWRAQLITEIASRAHLRTVAGVEGVISVECPYSLVSAVGHHLLDKHPAAPFAAMSVTGESAVTWSLRSHDDRMDVSEVAKRLGGGGHRNAAGFRVNDSRAAERGPETARSYPGLAMSDADLAKHFEASKRDVVSLVGSEVRQIIGELRHLRAALPAPVDERGIV